MDNLSSRSGARIPAQNRPSKVARIWLWLGLAAALALLAYAVVDKFPASSGSPHVVSKVPSLDPPAKAPPAVVSNSLATVAPEPQAATITTEIDGSAHANSASTQGDPRTALEKDVMPPPLTLRKALESPPTATAPEHPTARAQTTSRKKTKSVKASSNSATTPDRDVEILSVLVAHNAARRASSAAGTAVPAPTDSVKITLPQKSATAIPASGNLLAPQKPD